MALDALRQCVAHAQSKLQQLCRDALYFVALSIVLTSLFQFGLLENCTRFRTQTALRVVLFLTACFLAIRLLLVSLLCCGSCHVRLPMRYTSGCLVFMSLISGNSACELVLGVALAAAGDGWMPTAVLLFTSCSVDMVLNYHFLLCVVSRLDGQASLGRNAPDKGQFALDLLTFWRLNVSVNGKALSSISASGKDLVIAEVPEKEEVHLPADIEKLCVICLQGFEDTQIVAQLPCGHVFHKHCILTWLGRCRTGQHQCPSRCLMPSCDLSKRLDSGPEFSV
eukprot:gb/GFBE01047071.1/.p1 GENE.gb/GFBE01047071.1/~~gb/GFBE01047071.1/.p1  ORF type:complete len:281 (+),score=42.28 gb/GFBE01047071.1/:1-843(+)